MLWFSCIILGLIGNGIMVISHINHSSEKKLKITNLNRLAIPIFLSSAISAVLIFHIYGHYDWSDSIIFESIICMFSYTLMGSIALLLEYCHEKRGKKNAK